MFRNIYFCLKMSVNVTCGDIKITAGQSSIDPRAVKILGRYQQLKTFDTPEEFNKYYNKHKEEIDVKTTNQLNKEYVIRGYKITKRNIQMIDGVKRGDIHLKPITLPAELPTTLVTALTQPEAGSKLSVCEDLIRDQINDIYSKINALNELYNKMAEVINQMCS